MASNELYAQLEACRRQAGAVFECWVDGVSIQVHNRGGFFCRVALPGRIGTQNEQLAPLLRLVEASMNAAEPIALAYDGRQQRACLVRWLPAEADTPSCSRLSNTWPTSKRHGPWCSPNRPRAKRQTDQPCVLRWGWGWCTED